MAERRAGVLFDVDGTLIDSSYLHTLAWWRALRDVGERASMNAIHRLMGMGGDQLVPRLLGHQVPEANERRTVRYGELRDQVTAFPGAAEALRKAREAGLIVVLATSSPGDEVDTAGRAARPAGPQLAWSSSASRGSMRMMAPSILEPRSG
jgi:beta-phosphoglucomutase-like phosphatase (HAD superfamily)